jgi:hypothetical protein
LDFKLIILTFTLLTSISALGFNKDFTTVNDRVPYEFKLMFESLKSDSKTKADQFKLVALAQDLNTNLAPLQKNTIFFLMKSEIIKNVLEYKIPKSRPFTPSQANVQRLFAKWEQNQKSYSSFSRWIIQSILAEMKQAEADGFILAGQDLRPQLFTGDKQAKTVRFLRFMKYASAWCDQIDSRSAGEFNQLASTVSWVTLDRLNQRALLLKRYASTSQSDTTTVTFNIPGELANYSPSEIKNLEEPPVPTLKEASEATRQEAEEQTQKLAPEDLSPLSEDIQKKIDDQLPVE